MTDTVSAAGRPTTYVLPPLSLEFKYTQKTQTAVVLDVYARSGTHCFLHREALVYYDHDGDVPVIVSAYLAKWTLWLAELERERRSEARGWQQRRLFDMPRYPAAPLAPVPDATLND